MERVRAAGDDVRSVERVRARADSPEQRCLPVAEGAPEDDVICDRARNRLVAPGAVIGQEDCVQPLRLRRLGHDAQVLRCVGAHGRGVHVHVCSIPLPRRSGMRDPDGVSAAEAHRERRGQPQPPDQAPAAAAVVRLPEFVRLWPTECMSLPSRNGSGHSAQPLQADGRTQSTPVERRQCDGRVSTALRLPQQRGTEARDPPGATRTRTSALHRRDGSDDAAAERQPPSAERQCMRRAPCRSGRPS